ncbi:hypothetical protein M9458_056723 [Cirrhinus mrigala]|uniref:Uncharacterized protein n=1 Tax=Cirrhinus mrigala TaxID=683832 RepID=A0ABD0MH76_CIRMR
MQLSPERSLWLPPTAVSGNPHRSTNPLHFPQFRTWGSPLPVPENFAAIGSSDRPGDTIGESRDGSANHHRTVCTGLNPVGPPAPIGSPHRSNGTACASTAGTPANTSSHATARDATRDHTITGGAGVCREPAFGVSREVRRIARQMQGISVAVLTVCQPAAASIPNGRG